MVTGATLHKARMFASKEKLTLLHSKLLTLARTYQWQLEAWAVFVNHYHFVGRRNSQSQPLDEFLRHLHSNTSRKLNQIDHCMGRQTWHNFWDKKLTYERSYFARLNYVHQNAVKHGLVNVASRYPWCSAAWFERTVSPAVVKTIYSFKTDRLQIADDY